MSCQKVGRWSSRHGATVRAALRVLLIGSAGLGFFGSGTAYGGQSLTLTQTTNSNTNNSVLGCEACAAITSATDPHPDTSVPIFSGDPRASALPSAIAKGLAPDNQFGQGVPDGSSGLPITQSTSLAGVNSDQTTVAFSNTFNGTPTSDGGRTNTITQTIDQVIPGGDSATAGLADQQFLIHFQLTSLTDADGKLIGAATGTSFQTLNGVETTNQFTFDSTSGVVPSEPFPDPTTFVPPSIP